MQITCAACLFGSPNGVCVSVGPLRGPGRALPIARLIVPDAGFKATDHIRSIDRITERTGNLPVAVSALLAGKTAWYQPCLKDSAVNSATVNTDPGRWNLSHPRPSHRSPVDATPTFALTGVAE